MKVLIYAPLAALSHHFETDLEIAEKHLQAGDEVYIITCNGQLKNLKFMSCRGWLRCNYCKSRQNDGLTKLSQTSKLTISTLDNLNSRAKETINDSMTIEELKALNYRNVDIGSGFLSSLVSDLRDPEPNLGLYKKEIDTSLNMMRNLTDYFDRILSTTKPDLVYFFNGRFSIYRPLLRLCQNRGIKFFVHERGSSNFLYSLTENNMPHDIETKHKEMQTIWHDSSLDENKKRTIANDWFIKRSKGIMESWRSFTDHQKTGQLPENWDTSKRNIAIFISSEDEFSSVPGWELNFFKSQYEGIRYILESLSAKSEMVFYIRIHPNLRGLKAKYIKDLEGLSSYKNCRIISADSDISSYTLLSSSEKIITFGSTIGIEATYWGKPSILLGKSFYQNHDVCFIPKNPAELLNLITNQNLASKSQLHTEKFGFWMATVGYKFKHYQPINLTVGLFKGRIILGNRVVQLLSYSALLLYDLYKILKGEYSLWHLTGKVRNKLQIIFGSR